MPLWSCQREDPLPLGNASKVKLATCQPELRRFAEAVSAGIDAGECPGVNDLAVLCGYRGEKEQNEAFAKGTSKLKWPNSKHNHLPSLAVDLAPYPVDWKNVAAFESLRVYALAVADTLGIRIRIISWDLPHYELSKEVLPRQS